MNYPKLHVDKRNRITCVSLTIEEKHIGISVVCKSSRHMYGLYSLRSDTVGMIEGKSVKNVIDNYNYLLVTRKYKRYSFKNDFISLFNLGDYI